MLTEQDVKMSHIFQISSPKWTCIFSLKSSYVGMSALFRHFSQKTICERKAFTLKASMERRSAYVGII